MRKIEKEQIVKGIERANPWWAQGHPGFKNLPQRVHFKRLYELVTRLNPIRALILMGPRRVGKTVLLHQLIDRLISEGRSPKTLMYISLDSPIFRMSFIEDLLIWGAEWAGTTPAGMTVFFDEIQYMENWEQQIKALVDAYPNTKIIVTGSAAAALHKQSKESGAGRFTNYLLPPLSFYEFMFIKGRIESWPAASVDLPKLNSLYLEYLNYGGFPESITSEHIRDRPEQYIGQDIIDKVLGRDLPSIFGITNPMELQRLFAALSYNTSNEISPDGLSKETGVPKADINKYIGFLESAFLIRVIEKTDMTLKKFLRRTHFKVVLTNPSLRSAVFGKVSGEEDDLEALAETAVFSQLIIHEGSYPSYKYARWHQGNSKGEVDLVHVTVIGEILAAVEIKWSDRFAMSKERPKSLISFCQEHGLESAVMTSKTVFSKTDYGRLSISHFPTSFLCFTVGLMGLVFDTTKGFLSADDRETAQKILSEENLGGRIGKDVAEGMSAINYLKADVSSYLASCMDAMTPLIQKEKTAKK